jgi:hypothetical protein
MAINHHNQAMLDWFGKINPQKKTKRKIWER